jgi:hypothetical protein
MLGPRNCAAAISEKDSGVRPIGPYIQVMIKTIRLTLAALVAVALMLGGLNGIASAKANVLIAANPCGMAASMAMPDTKPMPPCKGLRADCVNQMGCIAIHAVVAQSQTHESSVKYSPVSYWLSFFTPTGVAPVPEPFPPRNV